MHVLWGLARLPTKAFGRRLEDIANYRENGGTASLLAHNRYQGAAAIAWICEVAPPDAVVLWRGQETGAMEFAAAMLWPRLLADADRVQSDTVAGRTVATAARDGRTGAIVLVGAPDGVTVEVR